MAHLDKNIILVDSVLSLTEKAMAFCKEDTLSSLLKEIHFLQESLASDLHKQADNSHRTSRYSSMADVQNNMILAMANMVESRDGTTGGHIKRACSYISYLLNKVTESGEYSETITRDYSSLIKKAAPLYDIGKITISDAILQKPGRLTSEEFQIIKTHTIAGRELIIQNMENMADDDFLSIASNMSTYHHEKWNGKGYPFGLVREEIPLCARIVSICDVFDAIISKTHYSSTTSFEEAIRIMEQEKGESFDPRLLDLFLSSPNELKCLTTQLASNEIRYLIAEDGIHNCGDQVSFYKKMLQLFPAEMAERKKLLSSCFQGKDWNGLSIHLHALKGISRDIGAGKLSSLTEKMRLAALDQNEAYLSANRAAFLEVCDRTLADIQEYLDSVEGTL